MEIVTIKRMPKGGYRSGKKRRGQGEKDAGSEFRKGCDDSDGEGYQGVETGEGGRPREVEQRECKYSQRQRLKQSAN